MVRVLCSACPPLGQCHAAVFLQHAVPVLLRLPASCSAQRAQQLKPACAADANYWVGRYAELLRLAHDAIQPHVQGQPTMLVQTPLLSNLVLQLDDGKHSAPSFRLLICLQLVNAQLRTEAAVAAALRRLTCAVCEPGQDLERARLP